MCAPYAFTSATAVLTTGSGQKCSSAPTLPAVVGLTDDAQTLKDWNTMRVLLQQDSLGGVWSKTDLL